jgi:hypothetical protein
MVRRFALGSRYSKPSTAEDGLPRPTNSPSFCRAHAVSIAALRALCNAGIGWGTVRGLTLHGLALWQTFERWNRTPDVSPVVATIAADGLQKKDGKQVFFEETTRPGSIHLVTATFAAVKFFEKPAPRGTGKGSHGLPPGIQPFYILLRTQRSREKLVDKKTWPALMFPLRTAVLVNQPFGMLRCAVSDSVNR